MNILVLTNYQLYRDPSYSFVHQQARAYLALGHQVKVLIYTALGRKIYTGERMLTPYKKRNVDGVDLIYIGYLSFSNIGERFLNPRSAMCSLRMLRKMALGSFTPDVIHGHTLGASCCVMGKWLKKRYGSFFVITTHGSDTSIPAERGQREELKCLASVPDCVVAVSSALVRMLHDCGVTTPTKVIINGYSMTNLEPVEKRLPLSVIQVCHLLKQKRVHTTIEAVAQLKKQYPKLMLTIIGQGPERAALERLCLDLGISDAVSFLGEIPNKAVLAQMAQHRFFVMPSVREGFGVVYLEAMASGCITIGTTGEGIADFIKDGINGFLVPPDRPDLIAQRMLWCLEHPEEADRIARKGLEDAAGQTWEKNAREYVGLFEKWKGKYNHDRKTEADLGE